MLLNVNQLRAFYNAAKLGSVTKAAEQLMVTPPAITMQVKQFEESLGLRLMYRDGNSIRLTEVGATVFKKASTIFSQIREMEVFLEDISTARSGELHIGCPQTPAKYIMPGVISRFNDKYPGIKIILDLGSTSTLINNIINHENELAFVRHKSDEKRIKVKIIGGARVLLVTSANSAHLPVEEISINQLNSLPLIVPKTGSGMRDLIFEYLNKFMITPNIVMESASIDLIKEFIRQDVGVCFLEKFAVQRELADNIFKSINILAGLPTIRFGIGYLHKKNLSPAAWAFLHLLDKMDDIVPVPD